LTGSQKRLDVGERDRKNIAVQPLLAAPIQGFPARAAAMMPIDDSNREAIASRAARSALRALSVSFRHWWNRYCPCRFVRSPSKIHDVVLETSRL
jgi:hypothetical protein